jgi:hypothetical protein
MYISSSGMWSLSTRKPKKPQIIYNLQSLYDAAHLLELIAWKSEQVEKAQKVLTDEDIPEATYVEEVSWGDLKNGETYYVINPDTEGEEGKPVVIPGATRHYAFVRLSKKTKNNEGEFNIYDDRGNLSKTYTEGPSQAPGGWYEVKTVTLTPSYIFLDADKLLSAPQSAGNKRKKHSSNKLSKRRVKTKSRRRNNITHRRKQRR